MPDPDLVRILSKKFIFKDLDQDLWTELAKHFETVQFQTGDSLFQAGMKRVAYWILSSGEIEIVKLVWEKPRRIVLLGQEDTVGEGVFLDKTVHSTTARVVSPSLVYKLPAESFEAFAEDHPRPGLDILRRVSKLINHRLRYSGKRYVGRGEVYVDGSTREEHDLLGTYMVPADAYYGIQTARAVENFKISGNEISNFPAFINALAYIKKAAAITNRDLGDLDERRCWAISESCDEIIRGKLQGHFVVDIVQGGAGTSTNMNANEVIANRALEMLGFARGEYRELHPNNHVNLSQSTNDVYPTAIRIATLYNLQDLEESLKHLVAALHEKAVAFSEIIKIGRTQLQDAVPMTLGQEFEAYALSLEEDLREITQVYPLLYEINLGATAIGTGINSDERYPAIVAGELAKLTGFPFRVAKHLIKATQDAAVFVQISGTLKRAAVRLSKMSSDLRLLSSGPRAGLGEIRLPARQPGSSIMPGKVNPVIPEVVNQVAYHVIGNDLTVTMAAEAGQLELNVMEPIIAFNLFQSIEMLASAVNTLTKFCIRDISANEERCKAYVENSISIITALNPIIGYEHATRISKMALDTGRRVYDLVLEEGLISEEELKELLTPQRMTRPGRFRRPIQSQLPEM